MFDIGFSELLVIGLVALIAIIAGFGPYLAFHLFFQETVTTRYALPLVVPVAYLAARGFMAPARLKWFPGLGLGVAAISLATDFPRDRFDDTLLEAARRAGAKIVEVPAVVERVEGVLVEGRQRGDRARQDRHRVRALRHRLERVHGHVDAGLPDLAEVHPHQRHRPGREHGQEQQGQRSHQECGARQPHREGP